MTNPRRLASAGASPRAIRQHYDLDDAFFRLWLGDDLVYSCALWELDDPDDSLARAQDRKLDFFADRLSVRGRRVLDVGCGWGALLDRMFRVHGAAGGVGITLSPAQVQHAESRRVPGTSYRLESWVDHSPDEAYDAIACVEATEHFASDLLTPDEKVDVYRAFFERAASWLRPGGTVGLQLICLDNTGHERSRAGRGRFNDLILRDIFPESMSGSLSELVLGWETHFQLDELLVHTDHYRRTFRDWTLTFREHHALATALVGEEAARTFARYFAGGEAVFRLREQALYRVVLAKRPEPKAWAVPVLPSRIPAESPRGASAEAVRTHYDVSNAFYQLWLGPTMMYSSGLWDGATPDLESALRRKVDFFADQLAVRDRVLDIGCGWGWVLRHLAEKHEVSEAVGLTLSPAQRDYAADRPVPGVEVRLEDWADHEPVAPYAAIVSFGAFEHFARDGSTGPERVAAYRRFFETCRRWLAPDGRLALETIAHDDAPDTATPLGRGPLGDFVLSLYPESLCPHLSEIVLGFEPFFELEVLRSDGDDFARTCHAWLVALRERESEAAAEVGADVAARFRRYLAASEVQFRTRVITNYRFVLRRRPDLRV